MKKYNRYLLVLLILLFAAMPLTGCININIGSDIVNGSGKIITKDIALEHTLTGVKTMSAIDVVFDPSMKDNIKLEGDDNILEYVQVRQNGNGVLEIDFKENTGIYTLKNVIVYVPYIDGGLIESSSVGNISLKGEALTGDTFDLQVSSTGSINLAIEANKLTVNDSSTGTIKLTGSADTAEITLSSTGSFEGYEFKLNDAVVTVSSTGSAHVNVSGELNASASGPGDVVYAGNPKVSASGGGPGAVKPR